MGLTELKAVSAGAAMIATLRQGAKNTRACQWPGSTGADGAFVLVPLSVEELESAYAEAHKHFGERLGIPLTMYTAPDFHSEVNLQVLARAMRRSDDHARTYFADGDEARKLMRPEERDAITTEWLELLAIADPDIEQLDAETVAQIDAAVKKKDASRLRALPSRTLTSYIIGTANPSET